MRTLSSLFMEVNPEDLKSGKLVFIEAMHGNSDFGTLTLMNSDSVEVTLTFRDFMVYSLEPIDTYRLRMIYRFVELCWRKGLFQFIREGEAIGKSEEQLYKEWFMVRILMTIARYSVCF